MVIKQSRFKNNQLLLKFFFLKKEIQYTIYNSLLRNHFNTPLFRLSFTINIFFFNKKHYFKSFQKLTCPFTLSKKVPSKKFSYSRFFCHKVFNTLNVCNSIK